MRTLFYNPQFPFFDKLYICLNYTIQESPCSFCSFILVVFMVRDTGSQQMSWSHPTIPASTASLEPSKVLTTTIHSKPTSGAPNRRCNCIRLLLGIQINVWPHTTTPATEVQNLLKDWTRLYTWNHVRRIKPPMHKADCPRKGCLSGYSRSKFCLVKHRTNDFAFVLIFDRSCLVYLYISLFFFSLFFLSGIHFAFEIKWIYYLILLELSIPTSDGTMGRID